MPKLTFPDGRTQIFDQGTNGFMVAESISKSLLKNAVAISVNGIQIDLCDIIQEDAKIEIITLNSDQGLEIMRHTLTAQVLASAIKKLYPSAKLAIGPTVENGFYYDVLFEKPISTDDFPVIENEMKQIINSGSRILKTFKSKEDALRLFSSKKESYKVEIIKESEQNDNFQIYEQEKSKFFDLCRGPHLPSLRLVGPFKLTKLAGAYWRGDSKKEMLQRIYGTAWNNKQELNDYLNKIEEAEKRDHRKIGKDLDLFHMQEQAAGSVFWHHNGWKLYQTILKYVRNKLDNSGYEEVNTPQLVNRSLWEDSGHWEKFRDAMFVTEAEDKVLAIKPMNCPCHVQIFRQGTKSYRDLPLRMSEFGSCHRNEPSGALHGLMRVRAFTQDDAHIFCTEDQITKECLIVTNLILEIYKDLGFENVILKYSDRPEIRVGDDKVWDKSEKALLEAIKASKLEYSVNKGEGAFYGPKIEFVLRDAIGRDWQCGTLQVDLNLPERLGASFVDKDGTKKVPVMLHRALFGSLERFIGILIENYSGKLPFWISPLQTVIIPVSSDFDNYAKEVNKKIKKSGITSEVDLKNHNLNYKIREHSLAKIPILLICGKKEVDSNTVTIRRLDSNKQESMELKLFLKKFSALSKAPSN